MDLPKRLWKAFHRSAAALSGPFASTSPLMCLLWGTFDKELTGTGPHGRKEYERHDRLSSKRVRLGCSIRPLGAGQDG